MKPAKNKTPAPRPSPNKKRAPGAGPSARAPAAGASRKTAAPAALPTVTEAEYLASATSFASMLPPVTLEIAFAGRSNVGKSSLINALVGRKGLARTSNTPGCTRAINFFQIRCADGLGFHLVDLPGYGYARRSKSERSAWGSLLDRYLCERTTLRLVVLLADIRRGFEQEEHDLLAFLRPNPAVTRPPVAVVGVVTKVDKLPLAQRNVIMHKVVPSGLRALGTSAVTKEGIAQLWKQIYVALGVPHEAKTF